MRISHCLIILLGSFGLAAGAEKGQELIVVGSGSDNIVRFKLSTGEAKVLAKLASGSKPWSLAVNEQGELFVGLRGTQKNVVRLKPGRLGGANGPLVAEDLTPEIGRFGPGMMAFDARGLLNVAADTERSVLRYDVKSRELVDTISTGRGSNIVGLTIANDSLYVAEYFQKSVLRINLAADPKVCSPVVEHSEQLDRPYGLAVGHRGHLLVTNLEHDLLQEFDLKTGQFVRTFLDVKTLGATGVRDLLFDAVGKRYFLGSGNSVYELSPEGSLVARHENPGLTSVQGLVCRQSPD